MTAFPDAGVATVEEARCLYDRGYDILDVRCAAEIEANEKVRVNRRDDVEEEDCNAPRARRRDG